MTDHDYRLFLEQDQDKTEEVESNGLEPDRQEIE